MSLVPPTLYQRDADIFIVPPVFIFSMMHLQIGFCFLFLCFILNKSVNNLLLINLPIFCYNKWDEQPWFIQIRGSIIIITAVVHFLNILGQIPADNFHCDSVILFPFWSVICKEFSFFCTLKIWVEHMLACSPFWIGLYLSNAQSKFINTLWNLVLWAF